MPFYVSELLHKFLCCYSTITKGVSMSGTITLNGKPLTIAQFQQLRNEAMGA